MKNSIIDSYIMFWYYYRCDLFVSRTAGIAQSVVRRIGSAEVTGPIPVASLKMRIPQDIILGDFFVGGLRN